MGKTSKSEMILEVASRFRTGSGFVKTKKSLKFDIEQVKIEILSDEVSKKIGREKGNYISFNFDELLYFDAKAKNYLCKRICDCIKELLKKNKIILGKVLVVGLGNYAYACDSLGSKVVQKVLITKPYLEKNLFSKEQVAEVYAVSMGVYGTTGLDSSEVINSICKFLKPNLVVVIDSMVASDEKRLAKSIQISDTKLLPGGGVGNARKEISKENVGAPIFAVGVPFVVNTQNICNVSQNLIVTPKDIENKVKVASNIIAKALNLAFNNLTENEIAELTE